MPSHFYTLKIIGFLFSLSLMLLLFVQAQAQSEWPQWGGPGRNFISNSKGLAASWPQTGPKQLWTRPLGEAHSAIVVDGNTLYTMYSQGEHEAVIALAANTGKTIWEHKYDAPTAGINYEYGLGRMRRPYWSVICSTRLGQSVNCMRWTRKPARSPGLTTSIKISVAKRWGEGIHAAQ